MSIGAAEGSSLSSVSLENNSKNFASLFKESCPQFVNRIPMRLITYLHGVPQIVWEEDEVFQMPYKKKLLYVVIGKFSYGTPEIKELQKIIPTQCELKGDYNIGVLGMCHVLIHA